MKRCHILATSTSRPGRRRPPPLRFTEQHFKEILAFGPEAQFALSQSYRDAFAVLDAIGWRRPDDPPETVDAAF
jgi:hypothetical protein